MRKRGLHGLAATGLAAAVTAAVLAGGGPAPSTGSDRDAAQEQAALCIYLSWPPRLCPLTI